MNTCNSRVLLKTTDRETTLFVTDMTKANVDVPKLIKWDEVELPTSWQIDRATPTLPIQAPEFQEIRQSEAGKVEIIFDQRNSFSSRSEATRSEYNSARRTFSVASQSFRNPAPRIIIPETNLQGLDNSSSIPRTIYSRPEEETSSEIHSPTQSEMLLLKPPLRAPISQKFLGKPTEAFSDDMVQSDHNNHDEDHDSDHDSADTLFNALINQCSIQKFYIDVIILIEDFVLKTIALFDTGADSNCILEGLIPTKYFYKTSEKLRTASGSRLEIQYKLPSAIIKNDNLKSKSPWSCAAFYVNKASEIERGAPRLVINYKPLNQALQWIRYPIPNKKDLLARLHSAKIFSKFDMKSGFWQIQINPSDRYKTAFTVPFGQYEWNVMPFGLKNAPSEFQNIMNDIFNPYSNFCIVYIDDVLIFSTSIDQHFKHLEIFFNVIKRNGLAISKTKICLFQTKIKFLGHEIFQGTIRPICRVIEFADKFPNQILEKTQLQRFLGCLNYIFDFFPQLSNITKPLHERLKKSPPP
uniref:Polyprotein n=1 Tax=Cajanus cajan TaxID=3821 RepID=A0A151U0J3_CAJCA|nr:polyprotein [Cajanus cajan]